MIEVLNRHFDLFLRKFFPYRRVMTLLKSRKARQESGKLVLEGKLLLEDALHSGAEAETIFFSRVETVKELPLHLTKAKLIKVPLREITAWSDLVTPHGVIGKQPLCLRKILERAELLL